MAEPVFFFLRHMPELIYEKQHTLKIKKSRGLSTPGPADRNSQAVFKMQI